MYDCLVQPSQPETSYRAPLAAGVSDAASFPSY